MTPLSIALRAVHSTGEAAHWTHLCWVDRPPRVLVTDLDGRVVAAVHPKRDRHEERWNRARRSTRRVAA